MRRFKRTTNSLQGRQNNVGVRLATPKTKSDVASYVPTNQKRTWQAASLQRMLHATPTIKTSVIPNSVTRIADQAFRRVVGLTSMIIPPSVTSLGIRSFADCINMTDIFIPISVTTINGPSFSFLIILAICTKNVQKYPISIVGGGEL